MFIKGVHHYSLFLLVHAGSLLTRLLIIIDYGRGSLLSSICFKRSNFPSFQLYFFTSLRLVYVTLYTTYSTDMDVTQLATIYTHPVLC